MESEQRYYSLLGSIPGERAGPAGGARSNLSDVEGLPRYLS